MARVLIVIILLASASFVAASAASSGEQPDQGAPVDWSIVELRQYTLHPGKRDVLIDLFDAEFVETQEAVGMQVVGQFRDLDRPDRFVWLRAFRDMPSRASALTAFYSGPVWAAHKTLANSTMIDSRDVLLLRPTGPHSGFPAPATPRPPRGATSTPNTLVVAVLYPFSDRVTPQVLTFFERTLRPSLARAGLPVLATLVTEESPNTFPALPVREREHVFVWLTKAANEDDYRQRMAELEALPQWIQAAGELRAHLRKPAEVLRLQPTARSALR